MGQNIRCSCGYEPKFQEEFNMLETWGCAKAVVRSTGGFGQAVTLCSAVGTGEPAEDIQEDPNAFIESYKQVINPPKDGPKK
jgi:hypothetical protein